MGQVLVRNLDDQVIESLKTKAELKGRSLEQELRDVLTNAAPLTPSEKIALFPVQSRVRRAKQRSADGISGDYALATRESFTYGPCAPDNTSD